jgi:aryl-alcohol dehydrogenase
MNCSCSITAALLESAGGRFSLQTLDLEAPRADEVRVKVVATGICHTDVAVRDSPVRMPKPAVLGHEGAGIIEAVGSAVTKVRPGDPVVLSFASCGACTSCLRGEPAYCSATQSLNFGGARPDGSSALRRGGALVHGHFFGQSSFATHALVHQRGVVRVPDDVPLETLGPLGCGLQTGAGAVLNSLKVRAGSRLAVYGVGSVGLAAVMAGRIAGADTVLAVDIHADRLALARELGATHAVDARDPQAEAQIRAALGPGADHALDTSGHVDTIRTAIRTLAPRGTCGLISSAKGAEIPVDALHLMVGGRSVMGVHQGGSVPELFIPQLIAHHRAGRFPFERLLRFYPLERINDAMDDLAHARVLKPVIRMP